MNLTVCMQAKHGMGAWESYPGSAASVAEHIHSYAGSRLIAGLCAVCNNQFGPVSDF